VGVRERRGRGRKRENEIQRVREKEESAYEVRNKANLEEDEVQVGLERALVRHAHLHAAGHVRED